MRKKNNILIFTIFMLIIAVAGCSFDQNAINSPVHTPKLKTVSKWLCNNVTNEKISLVNFREYDINGKLIHYQEFRTNGNIETESVYIYDQNETKEQIRDYSDNGEIIREKMISYIYADNGKLTKKTYLDSDGNIEKCLTYTYDGRGNLVLAIEYDASGEVVTTTEYINSYTADGKLIERITNPESDGSYLSRDSISYTSNLEISRYNFNSFGTIAIIYSYVYNSLGNIIFEIESKSDGAVLRKFIYDYEFH